jgi:hypothetical protein
LYIIADIINRIDKIKPLKVDAALQKTLSGILTKIDSGGFKFDQLSKILNQLNNTVGQFGRLF